MRICREPSANLNGLKPPRRPERLKHEQGLTRELPVRQCVSVLNTGHQVGGR